MQRFDSRPLHQTLIAKLEHYRTRLIESDTEVVAEISHHFPDVDRQHLMLLVGKAQRTFDDTSSLDLTGNPAYPYHHSAQLAPRASKAVFSYLKRSPINTSPQTPSRNLTSNRFELSEI